jgi:AAT family amino acid transporter/D-serine/D-alanine/glycine transporter
MWVVLGMAEITAVGVYVHYWFPQLPQWIPALVTLALLYFANMIAVKHFGEIEFWFALIKVATIVGLIVVGLAIIMFRTGELGKTAAFSNLWTHGGFFPFGPLGVILPLQMVMFSYEGLELIGVSAGETENPQKVLPHAVNSVVVRMLVLYLGSLLVIMSLVPWTDMSAKASPFVLVLEKTGIPAAAGLINFVVITAAASSCNSGLFSTGRMLFSLARSGQAPRAFGRLSRGNVPAAGVTASAALMLVGVALNYLIPERVFVYVTSISLVGSLWTWIVIVVAHLGYRKAIAAGRLRTHGFRLPGSPFSNWFVVGFLVLVALLLSLDDGTRVAVYVAPVWFATLGVGYRASKRGRLARAQA